MSLNNPLANALSQIMNCERISRPECIIKPSSKIIKNVLNLLKDQGYIGQFEIVDDGKAGIIRLNLLGKINKIGIIRPHFSTKKDNIEKYEKRFLPAKDFGILIISTSKGIMTHNEAKEKGLGGKLLCYCY